MWGLPSDVEHPVAYWGARAIKEGDGSFSFLPDRQSCEGSDKDRKRLVAWAKKELPKVQQWAKKQSWISTEVYSVAVGEFALKACHNASCGYVYVGAWIDPALRLKSHYTGKVAGENRYGLATPPKGKWSGKGAIPQVGERVTINFNNLGAGIVCAYFVECGWVGIEVSLDKVPEWLTKQCKREKTAPKNALVFGAELVVEEVALAQ